MDVFAERYGFAEAAEILGVKESWLRLHSTRLPAIRIGRRVWFTKEHLAEILAMHETRPTPPAPAAPVAVPPVVRVEGDYTSLRPSGATKNETPTTRHGTRGPRQQEKTA